MRISRCLVVTGPERMEMREYPIPAIGPREMLLKVEMVSICGSDPKKYQGTAMWAVEWGGMPFPFILGHEMVGHLEEVGEEAGRLPAVRPGDRVVVEPYIACGRCRYCGSGNYQLCTTRHTYGFSRSCAEPPHLWGGNAEYLFVAEGSKVHKVDPAVPAEAACLLSVIGNGIRWIKTRGELSFGETVVILGPGAQGLATVIAARQAGARRIIVLGLGRDRLKLDLAREFGATHTFTVEETPQIEAVRAATDGEMADLVVECTGASSSIALAPELLRPLGRCVLVGSMGGGKTAAMATDRWTLKELTVRGGLGQAWNCEDATQILNARQVAIEKMITHVLPLERGEEGMRFFMEGRPDCIRVALRP
ncbi:MAG: alcohol dehydrogenase catalytic domain-containing protein [candidate division NC10 bacterium]